MFAKSKSLWIVILMIGLLGATCQVGWGQDKRSELGERQRLIERKMVELEGAFSAVAIRMQAKEPERAKRLIMAYQAAKELLITRKMAEAGKLLDENKFDEATVKMEEVVGHIRELVKLLRNEDAKKMSKREELEMLQKWKQAIQDLQQEQNKQTRDTNKVANKEETLNRLDQQLKQLKGLMEKQQRVMKATEESKGSGLNKMDRLADQQFEVRKETEGLAKEIASDPSKQIGKGQDGKGRTEKDRTERDRTEKDRTAKDRTETGQDGKGQDGKGQDGKGQDGKGQDGKGQDGKGQDGKGQDGKGQDGKGQDGKGQDGKGQDGKGQDGKGQGGSQGAPQPGQKPLEQAAKNQTRAEEKLGSGKSEDAKRQQEAALREMKRAENELKKERRRIASLPPEAFEKMAQAQRRTREKALDLIKKMAEAKTGEKKEGSGGQQQAGQQQSGQPGQKGMNQAGQNMEQAAKNLQDSDPQKAERQQREAEAQMQKALDEIEERLNQLREETKEEKLARLESRFKEMLERQVVASVMTTEIEDKKINLKQLRRRDQFMMLQLATEEDEISELAQQAYDLLLEDGTSIAFPEIVQDLRVDLASVSELLQKEDTGLLTQLVQKEIESTLRELLQSLKEEQKDNKNQGSGGGGGGGEQPLLKKSAELKLIRSKQRRLNRRTQGIDRLRTRAAADKVEDYENELDRLSGLQQKLLEMVEKLGEAGQ